MIRAPQNSWRLTAVLTVVTLALVTSPCVAAFTNLWLVNYQCQPPGLNGHRVWRVYARFSNPGDRLQGVFGNASSPLTVTAPGGFFQHPLTGNTAPNGALIEKVPTVEWDTFCTIGLARNIDGADQTIVTPNFPRFPVVNNTQMGWLVAPDALAQGAPDSGGLALIMQLTVPGPPFAAPTISVGLIYRPAGSTTSVTLNNVTPVLLPLTAGDVNGDLQVNVNDLLLVITTWGGTGPGIADANDDGQVDVDDLLLVITHWGFSPGACP